MGDIEGILNEHFFDHSLLFDDRGDIAMNAHRERPFLGQPQTVHGKRGQIEVQNLRMRDIADCIARGFAQACAPGDTWDFDEHAMIQNAMCNVEKMMGIYPAIDRLKYDS